MFRNSIELFNFLPLIDLHYKVAHCKKRNSLAIILVSLYGEYTPLVGTNKLYSKIVNKNYYRELR